MADKTPRCDGTSESILANNKLVLPRTLKCTNLVEIVPKLTNYRLVKFAAGVWLGRFLYGRILHNRPYQ